MKVLEKNLNQFFASRNLDAPTNFCLESEFKTKLRMKFDYFNENSDISNESIGRIKDEMSKMKDEVLSASGLLDERGGNIEILGKKSDNLSNNSNTFYKNASRVRKAEMMKKIKLYAAIVCVILLIIYIIICFI